MRVYSYYDLAVTVLQDSLFTVEPYHLPTTPTGQLRISTLHRPNPTWTVLILTDTEFSTIMPPQSDLHAKSVWYQCLTLELDFVTL